MKWFYTLFLIITLFLPSAGYSDVPLMINFQGKLTDNSGTPLNGTYTISFYLYTEETLGSPVWEDENKQVELNNGILSEQIGANSLVPLTVDIFDSPTLYLEVAVYNDENKEWEIMTPRQRLTTVAYAFNSEQISGNTLADLDARYADGANLYAGGWINQNGTSGGVFGKPFTVKRDGVGQYTITLPGYNVGCTHVNSPHLIATAVSYLDVGAGIINRYGGAVSDCTTGDTEISIRIWSLTGALKDLHFEFILVEPER